MREKMNKKGFTLAELLIVVAIIAVLVAIAIPVFTTQLEKARESTDMADARAYYAEIATALVSGDLYDDDDHSTIHVGANLEAEGEFTDGVITTVTVSGWEAHQTVAEWQSGEQEIAGVIIDATDNWVGATSIVYTFDVDDDGDPYLDDVEATAP